MKVTVLGGALVASALALSACGQSRTGGNNTAAAANEAASKAADKDDGGDQEAAAGGESAGSTEAASAGSQQDFTLVNNTGRTLETLNVSPSDTDQWGPDILGVDTVANGAGGTVQFARGQDQCLWDLRATFADGEEGDWRGINLCETSTITLTPT